jgi:glycosyltransferase involved in cell wall biosynthesis
MRERANQESVPLHIAVVSPFLDRRHGTEGCVIEQLERLSSDYGWGIYLFSQRVEDVDNLLLEDPQHPVDGFIRWHRVTDIPGPHIVKFLWWFFANRMLRRRTFKRMANKPVLVYSPGINCLDADAITVHIVFHEFFERVSHELELRKVPVSRWPVTLHRKLYYRLIMALERRIYTNRKVRLAAVSTLVSEQLARHFGRADAVVIPNAVDTTRFNTSSRMSRRLASRDNLGLGASDFAILLIGNDWKKKGLDTLLRALAAIAETPIQLLVVGKDDPTFYRNRVRQLKIENRVRFLAPSPDVVSFYAAVDAYVAPSLEDAFGLPIMEAMACGLPVIASVQAGASENIIHGTTGLLLRNPANHEELAELLRQVVGGKVAADEMGAAAADAVQISFSWDQNASATREFLISSMGSNPTDASKIQPAGRVSQREGS